MNVKIIIIFIIFFCSKAYSFDSDPFLIKLKESVGENIASESLEKSLKTGLWNEGNTFVVSTLQLKESLLVYAIIKDNSDYRFVNASFIGNMRVEFGWAGFNDGDKIEVTPVSLKDYGNSFLVLVQKRAWIKGQRYTKVRPLVVLMNGAAYQQ